MGLHGTRLTARLQAVAGRWAWLAVALVGALILGWGGYELGQMRAERDALAVALEIEQRQTVESGQTPAAPSADEVRRDPEVVEGKPIPPTEEQLRPLVREFVDSWLARNPPSDGRDGETPTTDELVAIVTPIVATEIARNPPRDGADGRTPTAAEIRPVVIQVVDAWLTANPPPAGEDGRDGVDGEDGADGEDGQDGADGADGEQGPSGPPGPACPDGWHLEERTVLTPPERWLVCVQDQ